MSIRATVITVTNKEGIKLIRKEIKENRRRRLLMRLIKERRARRNQ